MGIWGYGSNGLSHSGKQPLENVSRKFLNLKYSFFLLQILHLRAGDTLELRMTGGGDIAKITLNIELTGLGFD